jgi:hypothetical protein
MRLVTWTSRLALAFVMATALVAGAGVARAGRTPFGWVRATEVLPERGVELETWIFEENGVGNDDDPDTTPDETTLWWTTVVGITDRIEVALPVEFRHLQLGEADGESLLYGFGLEGRWRLVSPDPVEAGPLAPVVRLGVHRLVNARRKTRAEAGATLGIDLGEYVHVAVDAGATWLVDRDDSDLEVTPAAGVSVRIVDQLRVGGEAYGEFTVNGEENDWVAAGPNLAWTHGRFWVSGTVLIGILDITAAPRVNWGMAF